MCGISGFNWTDENLIRDKVDVPKWMIEFVENYPVRFYVYESKQEDIK